MVDDATVRRRFALIAAARNAVVPEAHYFVPAESIRTYNELLEALADELERATQ